MTTSAELIRQLQAKNVPLLEKFDPHTAIECFDAINRGCFYHDVSEELKSMWHDIIREFGGDGFGAFQKLVMLYLMEDFNARARQFRYVDEILQCFQFSFARIRKSIEDPACADYDTVNDILLKDLALCRQVMFPAGVGVVESHSGFSRAMMFRGGIKQIRTMLRLLRQTGGHSGYYAYHTHKRELEDFNPEGYVKFYLRMADMLEVNPDVRGLATASWFVDPALKEVTPHLAKLHEQPALNGASFLYVGRSDSRSAMTRSATRSRLYNEGKYCPKVYCMVWPRKELIRWAAEFRKQTLQARQSHHTAGNFDLSGGNSRVKRESGRQACRYNS